MAKLRLFANLREIAGTSRLEVPAATVGQLLEAVNEKFGPDFAKGVETSRIWVNGDEADLADPVEERDEVVILPPVSGGGQPVTTFAPGDVGSFLPLAVAAVMLLANLQGVDVWAAALVAVSAGWALDLGLSFAMRRRAFAPLSLVTAVVGSTLAAHVLGPTGYGLAIAISVAVALGWGVAFAPYREVGVFAPTLLVALIGSLASASLVLTRSEFSPDPEAIDVFLAATIAGVALGAVVARLPALPFLDRFSTTAIVTVLAALVAAAVWDLNVVSYLLVGLGLAVSLVAGQGLSSMLRTGRVLLTERPPGFLAPLDGVVLAAAIYFPLIRLVL